MSKRASRRKRVAFTKSLLRFLRYWYLRLVRLQGHPREIARGLAVGVFSGCFPWFGLQIVIAILLAIIVRGNKIAAAAATWISNPLTDIPIFIFNYKVGEWLLELAEISPAEAKVELNLHSAAEIMDLGFNVLATTLLGSLWVGLVAAVFSYFLSLKIIHSSRKTKSLRPRLR
jgi:uncharacterized protein (DUF2062 family)